MATAESMKFAVVTWTALRCLIGSRRLRSKWQTYYWIARSILTLNTRMWLTRRRRSNRASRRLRLWSWKIKWNANNQRLTKSASSASSRRKISSSPRTSVRRSAPASLSFALRRRRLSRLHQRRNYCANTSGLCLTIGKSVHSSSKSLRLRKKKRRLIVQNDKSQPINIIR